MHPDDQYGDELNLENLRSEQDFQCPCCGSVDVQPKVKNRKYTPPFGKTVEYSVTILNCTACTEQTIYDDGPDDERVFAVLRRADQATVPIMLDVLESLGYSQPGIKRVLGLLGAHETDWRTGVPKGIVVLLRIITTYPWILEVAGARFDRGMAEAAPWHYHAENGRLSTLFPEVTNV